MASAVRRCRPARRVCHSSLELTWREMPVQASAAKSRPAYNLPCKTGLTCSMEVTSGHAACSSEISQQPLAAS